MSAQHHQMSSPFRNWLCGLLILMMLGLTACDEASEATGSTGANEAADSSTTDERADADEQAPAQNATASDQNYELSGTIRVAGGSLVDGDINNDSSSPHANNTLANAQAIGNPSIVGGYANARWQGPRGQSWRRGDLRDVYRAELAAGQTLRLDIASAAQGDLDLYLFDAQGNLLDASLSTGNTETLTVPAGGTYIIDVEVYRGHSLYRLTLSDTGGTALSPGQLRLSDAFVPGKLVVREQGPEQDKQISTASTAPKRAALWQVGAERQALDSSATPTQLLADAEPLPAALQARLATLRAAKDLRGQAHIASAEPNYRVQALAEPNDPLFGAQWHYANINLPQAWERANGEETIVAVVDSGVLLDHEDLQNQVRGNGYDFVANRDLALDGDGIDPNPTDPGDRAHTNRSSFHGTHVAGTIAAATNNRLGVAGVAPQAELMAIRVLGRDGGGTLYDVLQGIRYAAGLDNDAGVLPDRAADIINLSLGSPSASQTEAALYAQLFEQGIIVVAAAGNNGNNQPSYPAAYEGVISVSAVAADSRLAGYSNFGDSIDVAAPGGDLTVDRDGDGNVDGVLSTLGDDSSAAIRPVYAFLSGTSMAAPHVAGVAALMHSLAPDLDAGRFMQLLANGRLTEDLGQPGRDDRFGYGLIDANRATQAVASRDVEPVLGVSPSQLDLGAFDTSRTLTLSNLGDGELRIDSITADADWLEAAPAAIDEVSGLGRYTVRVERQTLAAGSHAATLRIDSTAGEAAARVQVEVLEQSRDSSLGLLYVLLLDADTHRVVQQRQLEPTAKGYAFGFEQVPAGRYHLVAGTDMDNDGVICTNGEACGALPNRRQPRTIEIDADRANLDFSVAFRLERGSTLAAVPARQIVESSIIE